MVAELREKLAEAQAIAESRRQLDWSEMDHTQAYETMRDIAEAGKQVVAFRKKLLALGGKSGLKQLFFCKLHRIAENLYPRTFFWNWLAFSFKQFLLQCPVMLLGEKNVSLRMGH